MFHLKISALDWLFFFGLWWKRNQTLEFLIGGMKIILILSNETNAFYRNKWN